MNDTEAMFARLAAFRFSPFSPFFHFMKVPFFFFFYLYLFFPSLHFSFHEFYGLCFAHFAEYKVLQFLAALVALPLEHWNDF